MTSPIRFEVGPSCTIADIAEHVTRWQANLAADTTSPQGWLIDLSGVEEVDGAGFQLLVSVCHAASDARQSLQWQWMPEQHPTSWLKTLLQASTAEVCHD